MSEVIETQTGEEVLAAPHGGDAVLLGIRCPTFGSIARVRLSRDQAAALAGALTGILLDRDADAWCLPDEI